MSHWETSHILLNEIQFFTLTRHEHFFATNMTKITLKVYPIFSLQKYILNSLLVEESIVTIE